MGPDVCMSKALADPWTYTFIPCDLFYNKKLKSMPTKHYKNHINQRNFPCSSKHTNKQYTKKSCLILTSYYTLFTSTIYFLLKWDYNNVSINNPSYNAAYKMFLFVLIRFGAFYLKLFLQYL